MSKEKEKIEKPGCLYRMFKAYLRFFHDKIYYKKTYCIHGEAVPENGTPLLIVSNHQNCLNDPLGLVFAFRDRKPHVITRADVFEVSPIADKFLRSIGLLPAFRLDYEGEAALGKNAATFRQSEQALIDGKTVIMYPEAGHQDKHWLGTFSFGYTKMAFEAAELGNFEKDVVILPACNHYSHYFGMRNRMLVKYGTPISLQPYYELYKTKPRTAQREVNKLVREQISSLMLDVRDLYNYEAIDIIRNIYGKDYASRCGVDPDYLPDRLMTDKALVAKIDAAREELTENECFIDALVLRDELEEYGLTDEHLRASVSPMMLGLRLMIALLLLPVWLFSWWPSMLVYWIPMAIFKLKMKDPMFEGTLLFGSAVLFTIPLFSLITLLVVGMNVGWLWAVIYVALFPLLMLFAWWYVHFAKHTIGQLKYIWHGKAVKGMKELKAVMYKKLDRIINQKSKE